MVHNFDVNNLSHANPIECAHDQWCTNYSCNDGSKVSSVAHYPIFWNFPLPNYTRLCATSYSYLIACIIQCQYYNYEIRLFSTCTMGTQPTMCWNRHIKGTTFLAMWRTPGAPPPLLMVTSSLVLFIGVGSLASCLKKRGGHVLCEIDHIFYCLSITYDPFNIPLSRSCCVDHFDMCWKHPHFPTWTHLTSTLLQHNKTIKLYISCTLHTH